MSLLIVGGTGTLGRQIVLQALTKGYQVRCLVRSFKKANFLKEWGAELVYGDLSSPETIPSCLKGITAIVDASTSRPDEPNSLFNVDWHGKLSLIKAAKTANIKKFVFFSTHNADQVQNIPLMKTKYGIEVALKKYQLPYTVFHLTGFYQGLIEQYAIPVLENFPVWVTNENTCIFYMDTQDIARVCLRSLQISDTVNKTYLLTGVKGWTSIEIIKLCEQFAGQNAEIQKIPLKLLKIIRSLFGFFEWGQNIHDRLSFLELLNNKINRSKSNFALYGLFKIDSLEVTQLDDYFLEYFVRLLKRLRDINFEDVQRQKNLLF